MNDKEKWEIINEALSTEEGRTKLVESMADEYRCGGQEYDKYGNSYLWLGGFPYLEKEFKKNYENNNCKIPYIWMETYRKTHNNFINYKEQTI